MNTLKILFLGLLFTSISAFSQQNYYNNSARRFGGVDRQIGRDYSAPKKPTPEEIEKDRNDRIEKFVTKLKTELTLDELQVIVIRNELIANSKNIEIVMKKEDAPEDKSTEVKALMDKTEIAIKSYLNKGQKEKYDILMEQLKTNQKEKKSKKKDEEKEKPTEE